VSRRGTIATTAADRTDAIITVQSGNHVIIPMGIGVTFTPTMWSIMVSNDTRVTERGVTTATKPQP